MLKLYFGVVLLVGSSVFSFKLMEGDDECCDLKTVGDVTYELVDKRDTSGYGCISNCVYKPVGGNSSSSFCFKRGSLPVTCGVDGEIGGTEGETLPHQDPFWLELFDYDYDDYDYDNGCRAIL